MLSGWFFRISGVIGGIAFSGLSDQLPRVRFWGDESGGISTNLWEPAIQAWAWVRDTASVVVVIGFRS